MCSCLHFLIKSALLLVCIFYHSWWIADEDMQQSGRGVATLSQRDCSLGWLCAENWCDSSSRYSSRYWPRANATIARAFMTLSLSWICWHDGSDQRNRASRSTSPELCSTSQTHAICTTTHNVIIVGVIIPLPTQPPRSKCDLNVNVLERLLTETRLLEQA